MLVGLDDSESAFFLGHPVYHYPFKQAREKCKHFAETYSSNCLRKFYGGSSDLGELENKEQEADSRG